MPGNLQLLPELRNSYDVAWNVSKYKNEQYHTWGKGKSAWEQAE